MIKQHYYTVQGDYGDGWEDVEDIPKTDPEAKDKAEKLRSQVVESDAVPCRVVSTRK